MNEKKLMFSNKELCRLILPMIMEQMLAVLVGLADTIMVACVGESAVASVSLVDNINVLLIGVFSALATGGAVVAGQFMGHGDDEKACRAGEQLVILWRAFPCLLCF
jgi:Na+-driven multidrug efflux pump